MDFPIGYVFSPPTHDLILHFLKNKILDTELLANPIPTIDLYTYNPFQIPFDKFKGGRKGEWYFYTTRPKDNVVPVLDGYWQSTLNIKVEYEGKVIGSRQTTQFYFGVSPNGKKTNWVITEFRIDPQAFEAVELDNNIKDKIENFIVCKVNVIEEVYRPLEIMDSIFV